MTLVLSRISPLPKSRRTMSARAPHVHELSSWLGNCVRSHGAMLRIHRAGGRRIVFTISGRLTADSVNELCQLVDAEPAGSVPVLDLTDLVLADRDAVRFLREYEARGRVVLRNCPAYVRTWMVGEHDRT